MANCYIQIRCGMSHKEMTVGREYDFAVGEHDSKISPEAMLDFLEVAILKAIKEQYGEMYELQGK